MELQQLTHIYPLKRMFNSQYGFISYGEWLEHEKNRIEKNPRRIIAIRYGKNSEGETGALWGNVYCSELHCYELAKYRIQLTARGWTNRCEKHKSISEKRSVY